MDVIQRNLFGKLFARGKDREKSGSPDRFDRFSDRARHVLTLAHEEATRFKHNYIGTEHLLLGLIREEDGVAAIVLSNLEIEPQCVQNAVERIVGCGDGQAAGAVGLTPRAKKVIELAVDEARQLNHRYIGTEHLFLGLIREGNGIAAGVLESLGITLEGVRAQIMQVLTQRGNLGQASPPEVPVEAAALVAEGAHGHPCPQCAAVSPAYFRYCFNCGERLQEDT